MECGWSMAETIVEITKQKDSQVTTKKNYVSPHADMASAEAAQMLAESLPVNSDVTVDGGEALTKENAWDIWADE